LLGKRSKEIADPGQWGLPGGTVEPGERFIDAATREFKEEAGYKGEYRIVDSISLVKDDRLYKLFILVLPQLHPGVQRNEETEVFSWEEIERIPEREPKHWILKKLLALNLLDPISIERYISLVGQQEKYRI
tara:strand:+ start:1407 stop:1802 length:396 start_codon:yes stop_codon:yes gene_type:complete